MSLATALIEEVRLLGIEIDAAGSDLVLRPARSVPEWLIPQIRAAKPEILREIRRRQALKMLSDDPKLSRACVVDPDSAPGQVVVMLAIRGIGTCDLEIPRDLWDPFLFMKHIEGQRH
jgi:hypothetical protein